MELFSARRLTRIGVVAAIYVVATLLCAPLAYNAVQFRVSEMMMLLCYYHKDYIISMTIGCFLANIFSSLGMIDVVFGTSATLIAALLIWFVGRKAGLIVSSLFPVVVNAVIVGLEIKYVFGDPFWINALYVALGEFVCVTIAGVLVFKMLEKNKRFIKLITSN